jgi:hypothetical protein
MKATRRALGTVLLGGGLFLSGCAKTQLTSFAALENPAIAAQLRAFVAEKATQANAATNKLPSEVRAFFAVAAKGDWLAVSNAFIELRKHAGPYGPAWEPVVDTWGALAAFGEGDEIYSTAFGTNIIASIPPGSIYFGGTDPGRFIIAALQKSQVRAEPFFTLSPTALVDANYLAYLRGMYGTKIYTPTDDDLKRTYQEYTRVAVERQSKNQLKPGESVTVGADGQPQVSGMMAAVQVKGLLAKLIFDKNPDHEFFIEESFPFDWLYPHLEPHGLIFKINRQPLPGLSEPIVKEDHDYWRSLVRPMIGDWLTDDTSVEQVAAFVWKTFGKQDSSGFTGDPRFMQNVYSQRMFSKLRSSLAGLYAWRLQQATDPTEKARMAREADFAFRQAWALGPDSAEAVFRYVAFLMEQKRVADALRIAETAAQLPSQQGPEGQPMREVVVSLKGMQKAESAASGGK